MSHADGPLLPFTAADETADLLERPGEPNLILLELALGAHLDPGRLRAAVHAALAAHPMARARRAADGPWRRHSRWEIPGRLDHDPLTVAAPAALPRDERRTLMDTPVPLGASPLLRMRLVPGYEGDRLLVVAHHALFDAVSCLGFTAFVGRRYSGETDPPPALDPAAARTPRPVPPEPAAGSRRFTRPVRVARAGTAARDGYGCVLHALTAAETAALAGSARRRGVTVNDMLITALALAVTRWNTAHHRPAGPVRITMPINTRPAEHRFEAISNLSRLTSIDAGPATDGDPAALLACVAAQTQRAKRTHPPAGGPAAVLLGAPGVPHALRRAMVPAVRAAARRFADTTMLSNLGRLPEPLPFAGAAPVTGLWMAAPAPLPRGVSVSTLTVSGRLHVAVRHRMAVLDAAAAAAFTELFTGALADLARLPAVPERLPTEGADP